MIEIPDEMHAEAALEHEARTAGLSEDEKKIYNDGYLWASGDLLAAMADILTAEDLSASEKVEILNLIALQASMTLTVAGSITGKNYLSE